MTFDVEHGHNRNYEVFDGWKIFAGTNSIIFVVLLLRHRIRMVSDGETGGRAG